MSRQGVDQQSSDASLPGLGKRNRRKGKTEHVTSPVGQMPEGALSFRAIVLTNEKWPQILGDIYAVFHLVEESASASTTVAHPHERPIDVPFRGQGWAT